MDELELYGVAGLEAVIDRLRELAPSLPPRERVQAVVAEGRLHAVLAGLQQRDRDARREYLDGAEFREDMRLVAAAVPGSAAELRVQLGRLGVELPAPAVEGARVNRAAPRTVADVEALAVELKVAAEWKAKGEPLLAVGHVAGLCLDVHADALAVVLAGAPQLAGRFLALLEGADAAVVSGALERRMALTEVLRLPAAVRRSVAELLAAHGLGDVAAQIGGAT